MGELLPLKPRIEKSEATSLVGMVVFLASWAMMFGTLFFAYGYIRTHADRWPPPGLPTFPIGLGLGNTVILGLSSVLFQGAWRELLLARRRRFLVALWTAWALGLIFVMAQVWLWVQLHASGLPLRGAGTYGSVFYGLTGLHALHVLVGLGGVLVLCLRATFFAAFSATQNAAVRLWSLYWHFVGAVWLLLFVTVFCL